MTTTMTMNITISPKLNGLPKIDYRQLTELQGNLKDLSEKDFNKALKSIKDKGFFVPFFVWNAPDGTNYIIDGHQRLRILKTVNAEPYEFPFVPIEAKNIKEAKEKLLLVSSQYGKTTKEGFDEFTFDLDVDFINDLTTFENFLDVDVPLLDSEADDVIPAEPKNIFVTRGDIFEVQANGITIRLGCLDSTNSDDIAKLMNGQKAQIGFTSPPYNASKNSHLNGVLKGFDEKYQDKNDAKTDDEYLQFLKDITNNTVIYSDYSFINLQMLAHNKIVLIDYQYELKEFLKDILIWNKLQCPPNIVKGAFNTKFEYVFCFSKNNKTRGFPCNWQGKYPNVIETENSSGNQFASEHKATFPVSFPEWIIDKMDFAKSVLDVFCGTGTTAIACLKTKRNCFTNDISENYVQIALKRIIDYCAANDLECSITLNNEPFDVSKLD